MTAEAPPSRTSARALTEAACRLSAAARWLEQAAAGVAEPAVAVAACRKLVDAGLTELEPRQPCDWRARDAELVAGHLDRLGLPDAAGWPEALGSLRNAGLNVTRRAVTDAIRLRRKRAELSPS